MIKRWLLIACGGLLAEKWLMKSLTPVFFVIVISMFGAELESKRNILGIFLNMGHEKAQARLTEIGRFVRNEGKRQEVWQVKDASFSHLVVGFDAENSVRYVTAVAREDKDAKHLSYKEIGELKNARQAGDPKIKNFNYEWKIPAAKGEPETLVVIRGRDPKFLSLYSLKRLGGEGETEEVD